MPTSSDQQVTAIANILAILIPLGIEAGEAIARAIHAVHGPTLTEEEIAAMISWLEEDSAISAALTAADARGGTFTAPD
jgi:hypothetical protein